MVVVMADVDREDVFEVSAVHDQEPVEAVGCGNSAAVVGAVSGGR
jgi:hypothetical protein